MNLKYIYIIYFSLIVLISQGINAQHTYFSQNYTLSDYKAGNQNWDIKKAKNGKLYVANNNGLLEFDGLKWRLWEMPNKTAVRSVFIHNERIYVGSFGEFGYWIRDSKGFLRYTSLIDYYKEISIRNNEDFWQICLINESIIFRSFSAIYQFKNNEIIPYDLGLTMMSCNVIENQLFVSTLKSGIFILKDNKLVPFLSDEVLEDTRIISITAKNENELFITTSLKGCFVVKNKKLIRWNTEINEIIQNQQLNRFSKLENGNMVFGTIKNGVYVTDNLGNVLYNFNTEIGLTNNTVLGQYIGSDNELWLGLDNGITLIDLGSPYYFFNDISGKVGAVYDVIKYKETIYIGSNTGVYYINENNKLDFIEGSQGQVWDLKEINGDLFCGHNNGTYIIKNKEFKQISPHTGGWVIKKAPEEENTYVQGSYTGLVVFKKQKNTWKVKHLGKHIIPIRFLVFEDQYTAWVAQANKGLYRVKFDSEHENIISLEEYSEKGLLSNFNIRIFKLNNTIAFHSQKGWYKYEALIDSIVPYDLINNEIGANRYLISGENKEISVFKTENIITIEPGDSDNRSGFIPNKYYNERLITGYENISKITDSLFALNLYNGYMLINPFDFSLNNKLEKPSIERIFINNKSIDLDSENIELPFQYNSFGVEVSSPTSKNHSFEYNLSNINVDPNWVEFKNGKLELMNLVDGDYTVAIRTIDTNQNKSTTSTLKFAILPPFYKSTIAFFFYGLLVIFILFLIYLLHKRNVRKEQKLLLLKHEEAQSKLIKERTLDKEKEIINIKNETLKNEVKLKSKQLANTAMALVKKNEILLILKKELLLNKDSFQNLFSFNKLIKQINNSIEHEDEWKIFEYNFNQVHAEFFHQLTAEFPPLTNKDLKICAYIKMNLTNKEIAPLLNISVRGVETHRYRLKKKLSLENKENLTFFLQNFH